MSVLIATIASVAELVLLGFGASDLVSPLGPLRGQPAPVVSILLVVLGTIVLGAAPISIRWSRLGPILVGASHIAYGLFSVLGALRVPLLGDLYAIIAAPIQALGREFGLGISPFIASGAGAIIGSALLAAGIMAGRDRHASRGWRIASLVGGVLAIGMSFLGLAFGVTLRQRRMLARSPESRS